MDLIYGIYIQSGELNRNLRKKINGSNYTEAFQAISTVYKTFMGLAGHKSPKVLSKYVIEKDDYNETSDLDEPISGILIGFLVREDLTSGQQCLPRTPLDLYAPEKERLFLDFLKEEYHLKKDIYYYYAE